MGKFSWGSCVFLAIILFMIPKLKSSAPNFIYNYCSNTTTFATADTSYPQNLNTVFKSLSSAAAISGFATASAGNGTDDAVFGLFLCRGDLTPSLCSNCVATAVKDQPKTTMCPRSKVGIIWYDECMIRYDNQNFFGRMDQMPTIGLFNTRNITGKQSRFTELLGDTLTDLAVETANGRTGKKYGTRVVNFTSPETLYELEQCTPNLSDIDCDQCLTNAIGQMWKKGAVGILQPSCNVRYEIYPLFKGDTNISSPPPYSPPSATANMSSLPSSATTNSSTGAGSETGNGGEARKFTIANNCSHTVWPAFSSAYNGTIFSLGTQQSRVVDLPPGSSFQIWARTGCTNSAAGSFTCQTGDYGSGKGNCSRYVIPPATNFVNFALNLFADMDFYYVSLVTGYNVAVAVIPQGGNGSNCAVTGCIYDIEGACPHELKLGGACQSPCNAFNNAVYCCTSNHLTPETCQPTPYSTLFKKACPRAYSYPLDGDTRTFSCGGSPAFTVTFCPSSPTLISKLSEPLNSSASPSSPSFPSSSRPNVLIAVPTSTIILILLFLGIWILMKKNKAKERHNVDIDEISTMESLQFDISTIRAATHNFSIDNKLGEGGFGEVYKGKLPSGQEVAVKRLLQNSKQGVMEFKTEVVLVAKLQHKNLVKLLGFCVTSKEKILVYEFLPNSSLDRFLFDRTSSASMDWQTRLNIIVGVARGLMYLHEDSRLKVIHRDLKTSNILLDDSMNPKISDFGLAKLFGEGQTQGDTKRIVGTYGYMAPEYAITGHYSVKSDVYSFGVIVLEIISGRKNRFIGGLQGEEALLHQAWRLWNEGKALDLVDTTLNEDFSLEEVIRCYQIGLLCIQEDAIQRPRMRWILDALSRPSIGLPEPTAPRFFGDPVKPDQGHHTYTGTQTITELYPLINYLHYYPMQCMTSTFVRVTHGAVL